MPSPEHQILVDVVRADPLVVTDLLALSGELSVPAGTPYGVVESTFSELKSIDFHVDLALTAPPGAPPEAANVLFEVQLNLDPDKPYSWPVYVSMLRRQRKRDAILVVLTTDQAVADWIGSEIPLSRDGSRLVVHLLGPAELRKASTASLSQAHPALAVMIGLVPAGEPDGFPPMRDAVDALQEGGFGESTRRIIYDIFLAKALEAVRRALESYMEIKGYEWQSDLARNSFAEGERKGLEEGEKKGREAGREEGRKMTLRETLRDVLRSRGVELSTEQLARIEACADEALLKSWLERAYMAQAPVDLFDA